MAAKRFLQNVAGLRQRAFAGVDEQNDTIDHAQRALHFAAKIAVAGRVHDIDFGVMEEQRGVLRQNGDAALALQVVGVHHALDDGFIGAKDAALPQHGVNQRGLAVVDVSDNGDIAYVGSHVFNASSDKNGC